MKKVLAVALLIFAFVAGSSFYNTAITVQKPVSAPGCTVSVYGNEITNCRIGIHALNLPQVRIGIDENQNYGSSYTNTIRYHLETAPDDYHTGIWLQNSPEARVVSNVIENIPGPVIGTSLFRGIDVEASTDCRINCNEITNLPYSMNFMGYCEGTLLRANVMTEYDEAIHLDGAKLPDQYQINNSSGAIEPTDNIWNDASTGSGSFTDRVTGTSSGSPINWYYRNDIPPPTPYDPLDDGMISQGNIIISVPYNPGTVPCDDITDRQSREQRFGAVVGDSLHLSEYENETRYVAQSNTYKALKDSIELLYQGNNNDLVFQNFFMEMAQSNIGIFDSINELSTDTTLVSAAITLNTAVNDTNNIEYYKKSINDIYLNKTAQNIPLTEADSILCDYISSLSYFTAGDAIYQAAAMIGKEIHPVYVALRKTYPPAKNKPTAPNADYKILPNPASTIINISGDVNLLKEISLLGSDSKVVKRFNAPLQPEFSIADFAAGFYTVKVTDNRGKMTFLKLSIIR